MFTPSKNTLQNGITLITTPVEHVHLTSIYAFVKTGALYEESDERGYAHLLEHLLLKRMTTHRDEDLHKFCTTHGMYFNAETAMEYTSYYILDIIPEYLDKALEMMAKILFEPVFSAKDLEQEKEIVISELKDRMSSPHFAMQKAFNTYFFGDHPYGRDAGGEIDQVLDATYERVQQYHRRHYVPENVIISLAGPTTTNAQNANGIFDVYKKEQAPVSHIPPFSFPEKKEFLYLLDFAETVTTQYFFQIPGRTEYSPQERAALHAFTYILGGNRYSKLLMKLREEHNLVYDAHAYRSYTQTYGSLCIETSFQDQHKEKIVEVLKSIIEDMKSTPVSQEELEEAVTSLEVDYLRQIDDVNSVAHTPGKTYLYRKQVTSPQDNLTYLKQVTPKDVQEVAKKYLNVEDAYTVVNYKKEIDIPSLT